MDHFRNLLFSKAFQVVPGPLYNPVSQDLRESGNILFYEVVLREETSWKHLRDRVYPALARYLRHKSISLDLPEGVVVSLFFQDRFYLLQASEFLRAYRETEGLDSKAFHLRVRTWLAETDGQEETPKEPEDADEFRRTLPAIRK
jgi:hypothetical protein